MLSEKKAAAKEGGCMRVTLLIWMLLFAPWTGAQAQALAVYGNLDLSVGFFNRSTVEGAASEAVSRIESGVTSGTYFGIKGQESVAGGAVVSFKLESSVSADTGAVAGEFWGRTSELGLSSPMGSLTLGRSLSLSFRASLMQSPFTVFRPLGLSGVTNFGAFQSNAVTYTLPIWRGWQSVMQYSPSEVSGQSGIRALQIARHLGPFEGAMTWTEDGQQDLLQLGGSYMGRFGRVFLQWAQARHPGAVPDAIHVHLGGAVPLLGRRQFRAAWTHIEQGGGLRRDGVATVLEQGLGPSVTVYAGWLWQCVHETTPARRYGQSVMLGLKQKF